MLLLSDQLKNKTKSAHQQLEKLLVQKIRKIETADDYVVILTHFYNFWKPLEKLIFSHIDGLVDDIAQRRKADWLTEDLKFFDASQALTLTPPQLPLIENSFQALGALYVMEGSTLGGQIICKMVAEKLKIPTKDGFNFFSGYGQETAERWKTFKSSLDAQSHTPEMTNGVIGAANDTFRLFEQSFRVGTDAVIFH